MMNRPRSSKEKIWFLFCNENKKRGKGECKTKSVNKKAKYCEEKLCGRDKKNYCD